MFSQKQKFQAKCEKLCKILSLLEISFKSYRIDFFPLPLSHHIRFLFCWSRALIAFYVFRLILQGFCEILLTHVRKHIRRMKGFFLDFLYDRKKQCIAYFTYMTSAHDRVSEFVCVRIQM